MTGSLFSLFLLSIQPTASCALASSSKCVEQLPHVEHHYDEHTERLERSHGLQDKDACCKFYADFGLQVPWEDSHDVRRPSRNHLQSSIWACVNWCRHHSFVSTRTIPTRRAALPASVRPLKLYWKWWQLRGHHRPKKNNEKNMNTLTMRNDIKQRSDKARAKVDCSEKSLRVLREDFETHFRIQLKTRKSVGQLKVVPHGIFRIFYQLIRRKCVPKSSKSSNPQSKTLRLFPEQSTLAQQREAFNSPQCGNF
jgi:hypothetical protein